MSDDECPLNDYDYSQPKPIKYCPFCGAEVTDNVCPDSGRRFWVDV